MMVACVVFKFFSSQVITLMTFNNVASVSLDGVFFSPLLLMWALILIWERGDNFILRVNCNFY